MMRCALRLQPAPHPPLPLPFPLLLPHPFAKGRKFRSVGRARPRPRRRQLLCRQLATCAAGAAFNRVIARLSAEIQTPVRQLYLTSHTSQEYEKSSRKHAVRRCNGPLPRSSLPAFIYLSIQNCGSLCHTADNAAGVLWPRQQMANTVLSIGLARRERTPRLVHFQFHLLLNAIMLHLKRIACDHSSSPNPPSPPAAALVRDAPFARAGRTPWLRLEMMRSPVLCS